MCSPAQIERRMTAALPRGRESVQGYKDRLRRTAMSIPAGVIRKGVQSMKKRAQAIFEADGKNIARD
jgi:hypothetical protein